MSKGHVFAFTWESIGANDAVIGSAEVQVKYTFRPGSPDTYDPGRGGPGGWDPGNPPEIEIDDVVVEGFVEGKPVWRTATAEEFEVYSEYASAKFEDAMIDEATQDMEAEREEAMEARAAARREDWR